MNMNRNQSPQSPRRHPEDPADKGQAFILDSRIFEEEDRRREKKRQSERLGVLLLLVFIGLSYFLGHVQGRLAAESEQPQNAALEAKLNRIEAAVNAAQNVACARVAVDAAAEVHQ